MTDLGPYQFNQVYMGDCRELGKDVPDNSIDLIFTDPPYLKKYLYLYEWLAGFSARVLKPDGFLMAYAGGYWKDKVMNYLNQHLNYFWDYTLVMAQDSSVVWQRRTIARTKSLLCYRPRNGTGMPRTNVLGSWTGSGVSKHYHKWGQDEEIARYYIDCFTYLGQVVLEPFTGGGTTLAVCKVLGRPCVGFEIDENSAKVAKLRIENTKQLVWQKELVPNLTGEQLKLGE